MATKLQLKQIQINDGAYGGDEMAATGLAAGDVLLVADVSNTSGSSYGYNVPMSASALRQALLQDLGGSSDLRVTGNAGFSGTLKVAGAVTGAAGTFTSLNARAGGITHAGAISGVGAYTATGSHYTSGSITQGGTGAVKFEGAINASSSATFQGAVSGAAGSFDGITGVSLFLQAGGITHAGAISGVGAYTATGSHYTSGSITQGGTGAVKLEGATTMSSSLTVTGAIEAASTIKAAGAITGSSFTNANANALIHASGGIIATGLESGGTISGSTGTFSTLTADKLNVHIIDSISTTENHLEVTDKVIISAVSGAIGSGAAALVGAGFQVGDGASAVANVTAMKIRVGASSSVGLPIIFANHAASDAGLKDRMEMRSGSLLPSTDQAMDLGVASSNRWKDIHMKGAVKFDSYNMLTSDGAFMVQSNVPAAGYGLEHNSGQLRIKGFAEQYFVSGSGAGHPLSASVANGHIFAPEVGANQLIGFTASLDTGNSGSVHTNVNSHKGNMEVYLNGVKLVSGSAAKGTGDYHFAASANKVCLYDALDPQDLVVVRWLRS